MIIPIAMWMLCKKFIAQRIMTRKAYIYIQYRCVLLGEKMYFFFDNFRHEYNEIWSSPSIILPHPPPSPTEQLLPSFSPLLLLCLIFSDPLSFIMGEHISMIEDYLLEYWQFISGHTTEENNTPSSRNHWLPIVPNGEMEPHKPLSPIHGRMSTGSILCGFLCS